MSTLEEPTGQQAAAQPHYGPPPVPQQYAPLSVPPQYGAPPQYAPPQYGAPVPGFQARPLGPVGKVRSTWAVIGLSLITLGIYSLYYYFATHQEMKEHSGEGVGSAVGLVIALFTFGLVTPFLFPHEVGNLYARQSRPRPVSATTGLWMLLGSLILVGPLVWLIKSNGALNAYWRSTGVR